MAGPSENLTTRTPPSIVAVEPGSELFEEVFALGESLKATVGMLPRDAWVEYAEQGRILAAVSELAPEAKPCLLGYVAYRLPRDRVTLAHLVVRTEHRRAGVARLLVDEVSARHAERRGIQVKCRRDYAASKTWPRLGFAAQGDMPGRGASRKPLTVWWRDHGHPDLMTWSGAPSSLTPVIIDANVFIDLHGNPSAQHPISREVLTGTLLGRIELLVTPELGNELNRREDDPDRAKLQRIRQSYPVLSVPAGQMASNREALITHLGRHPRGERDVSDLTHVAYAAAAGVRVVVTRDNGASRKLRAAARGLFDVALVGPQELVALLDEVESNDDAYTPIGLFGTGYSLREASVADHALLDAFLDSASGERRAEYNEGLRSLAEDRGRGARRLLLLSPQQTPVALLGARATGDVLDIAFMRMRPTQLASTLAAQLASRLRPLAVEAGATALRVTDHHPNPLLVEAMLADGFGAHPGGPVGIAVNARCTMAELPAVIAAAVEPLSDSEKQSIAVAGLAAQLTADSGPSAVAAVERQARPLRVVDAPIDTWIVPIKPAWSSQLFNMPPDLIGQTPELGISVEHVYYRAGRSGEKAPARILWYISDDAKGRPGSAGRLVIGCSELMEVRDGTPKDLHRTFRRLGVYGWKEVNASADKHGRVRALRVINTEIFARPITLQRLRRLAAEEGQTLQLISPGRISAELFARIITEGHA